MGGQQKGGVIDVWSGCADHLEESGHKTKAIIDKLKNW